jgi:hypothetical protein
VDGIKYNICYKQILFSNNKQIKYLVISKGRLKDMKRAVFLIGVLFCFLCFTGKAEAASEELFENPVRVYEQFADKIYNKEYRVKYGFAREGAPVYSDPYGSQQAGKIEKFSGLIIVSETESYVQVIYHNKDEYDIGWILQDFYSKEVKLYNGAEKQLLADGVYAIESYKKNRLFFVELIF